MNVFLKTFKNLLVQVKKEFEFTRTNNSLSCPYCGASLKKFPSRKTKCKSCGYFYFVKRDPRDGQRKIVTEEQANEINALWRKKEVRDQDKQWNDIHVKIDQALRAKPTNWLELKNYYSTLAVICIKKPPSVFQPLKIEAARCELRHYQQSGLRKVEILAALDSCQKCLSQNGKILSVEEALKTMPLPVLDCENGKWCRCCYAPVVER